VLGADGDLLGLHDAYREAGTSAAAGALKATDTPAVAAGPGHADPPGGPSPRGQESAGLTAGLWPGPREPEWPGETQEANAVPARSPGAPCPPAAPGQAVPTCVMIVWGDGTVTTVHPPQPRLI
jgi:hypothetical protein